MENEEKIFSCKCCGHCCHGESTVSMSDEEQVEIAGFLGVSTETLLNDYCVIKPGRVEMRVVEGHCIFYGDNGLCAIHPVKPFNCRRWPLHPSIKSDISAWNAIKKDCPGFSEDASWEDVCELVISKGW